MADESIRELIFEHIRNSLIANVNGIAPYKNTLTANGVNIVHGQNDENIPDTHVWIYPGTETIVLDRGEKGNLYKILTVVLEGWIRVSTLANTSLELNRWVADLERAMLADPYRNGLAIDTLPTANEPVAMSDLADHRVGVLYNFEVHYMQSFGDPASN